MKRLKKQNKTKQNNFQKKIKFDFQKQNKTIN